MANLLPERDLSEFTYVCVPIWRSQVVTSVGFSTSFNVFDYFTSRRYWELNKEKKKKPTPNCCVWGVGTSQQQQQPQTDCRNVRCNFKSEHWSPFTK